MTAVKSKIITIIILVAGRSSHVWHLSVCILTAVVVYLFSYYVISTVLQRRSGVSLCCLRSAVTCRMCPAVDGLQTRQQAAPQLCQAN